NIDVGQRYGGAFVAQSLGERPPKTGRGPCDEGNLSFELPRHFAFMLSRTRGTRSEPDQQFLRDESQRQRRHFAAWPGREVSVWREAVANAPRRWISVMSPYTGAVADDDALGELWIEPPDAVDGPRSDRIRRSNLSRQIAERLRDDIVHGRIAAGTHLIQDEVCERFGTSRMPVRDALQQLTHEGLLTQQGEQRLVVSLGTDDLEEVHRLVAVLHGWAAGQAAIKASDVELDELAAVCRQAVETEDRYEFGRLAMQFHRKINLLAH